jgi:mannose-6-phosphate isomerase-like protein (cupin superfamily)
MTDQPTKRPVVRGRHEIRPISCPFGHVERVVTGGEGGVANVHVVTISKGLPHVHVGYDEVYYFLSGSGTITLGEETRPVAPGTAAVIPAGVPHSLQADPETELEFVIFGTPPMPMEDARALPTKV